MATVNKTIYKTKFKMNKAKDIQEGNKLIAEFMGWKETEDSFRLGKRVYTRGMGEKVAKLSYHQSWDWLMPVVEKIEGMNYSVNILRAGCSIYDEDFRNKNDGWRKSITGTRKIETTWQCVIQFITWYNQNKTSPILNS